MPMIQMPMIVKSNDDKTPIVGRTLKDMRMQAIANRKREENEHPLGAFIKRYTINYRTDITICGFPYTTHEGECIARARGIQVSIRTKEGLKEWNFPNSEYNSIVALRSDLIMAWLINVERKK